MAGIRAHVLPAPTARTAGVLVLMLGVLAAVLPFLTRQAAAAPAPTPRHVAVAVEGVGSICTPADAGLTGAAAVERVAEPVRRHGRLVQLGSRPSSPTKYPKGRWSLWRVVSDAWKPAAAASTVKAGDVNVWTYNVHGSATPPKLKAASTYTTLCASLDRSNSNTQANGGNRIDVISPPTLDAPSKVTAAKSPKSGGATSARTKGTGKSSGGTSDASPGAPGGGVFGDSSKTAGKTTSAGRTTSAPRTASARPTTSGSGRSEQNVSDAATAQRSPSATTVASEQDAGGPGLGFATVALLVLLVGGGVGLYLVRRRLFDGAKA